MGFGVSASAQRAYYEYHQLDWPVCKCHGEPMRWNRSDDRRAGGRWRCAVASRRAVSECQKRLREAGLCITCCKRPLATKWHCRECNDSKDTAERRLRRDIYALYYRSRKKREAYENAGLTLRNHGKELGSIRDWNAD